MSANSCSNKLIDANVLHLNLGSEAICLTFRQEMYDENGQSNCLNIAPLHY
jgi:hypothetical protein